MNLDFDKIPTPCYLLDEKLLINNLSVLNKIQLKTGAKIICALKGFAMHCTFGIVNKYLSGTTASSLHEAKLGFQEFGKEVHAYCVAYISSDFDEIINYCSHITFNSLSEWNRYKSIVFENKKTKSISCGLRINPEYAEVETDLYNPCMPGSRLGITAENLGGKLPDGIDGIHFHTLCESSAESLERTLEVVEKRFGHLLKQAKWLNLGGGHAITRNGYNSELLIDLIINLKKKYNLEIILEPGSAVGWETGYLVTSILDIIESNKIKTAILDTSFAAHMPDCIEMPYKPKVINSLKKAENLFKYNLGGLTCLSGDFMSDYFFKNPLKVGDKIIFDDMIHYTMVKNHTFNGIQLPNIGIWKEDDTFKLIKSFGYQDYKSRLS